MAGRLGASLTTGAPSRNQHDPDKSWVMVEVPAFSGQDNSCGEANYSDGNNDKHGFHILFNTARGSRSCNQAGHPNDIPAGKVNPIRGERVGRPAIRR